MHDEVDDRIQRLDPFADAAYAHPDADAMVDRIVERSAPRRQPRRRAAVLAPLGATVAAGLVAAGLLAAPATTAPAPAALEVQIPHGHGAVYGVATSTPHPDHTMTSGCRGCTGSPLSPTAFVVAGPLATAAPSVDAFLTEAPANPTATLATAARYLGVGAAVSRAGAASWHTMWTGTSASTATLTRDAGTGLYVFRYGAPAPDASCASVKTNAAGGIWEPSVSVDPSSTTAALTGLLGALGDTYALSDPRFGASLRAGASGCTWVVTLGEQVVVGGVPTDQSATLALTPSGRVVSAQIPVFRVGPATPVALVSPAAAAASLQRATSPTVSAREGTPLLGLEPAYRYYPMGGAYRSFPDGTAYWYTEGNRYDQGTMQGAAGSQSFRVVPRNLITVELKTATVGLRAFKTAHGTWLLPVYDLTGDGYATAVPSSATPWSGQVLAASRVSVHLRGAPSNQSLVFGAQPLRP